MAISLPAGLFLDGRDACVLDAPLRRAVAEIGRRNGGVPSHLVRLAEQVTRTAAEFRATVLVEPGSGTEEDASGSVSALSPVSDNERLSAQQAARLADVSEEFIRRLAAKGVLQGTKSGERGGWLLDPGSVAVWIASRGRTAA